MNMSNNNESSPPSVEANNNESHHSGNEHAPSYNRKSSLSFEKRASIQSSGQCSLSSGSSGHGDDGEVRLLSSNADYDRIRNTTLMFFLDRLVIASKDGKEARTLHDLSCLFGTKDFTKEMRQIVGASRNGLKKFLESYPSLFTIDGDKVYLTQLQQNSDSNFARDYNKEAVEYFTNKLQQFGTSLVPIRNLFGYRSQASQEVRHISGKNTKEFKQFLLAHSDIFEILFDEHVVLKTALQELESRGETYSSLQPNCQPTSAEEAVSTDPYLNKQFAHMIEECMKKLEAESCDNLSMDKEETKQDSQLEKSKKEASNNLESGDVKPPATPTTTNKQFTIEFLHDKIMQDCNNQLFLKMVKTIDDLKVFLRMHPKIFKRVRSNEDQQEYVSLLTEQGRRELENNQSHLLARQHSSTLKRSDTAESNLSEVTSGQSNNNSNNVQPNSLPPIVSSGRHVSSNNRVSTGKAAKMMMPNEDSCDQKSPIKQSHSISNNSNSPLRATAPPFVPSSVRRTSTGGTTTNSTRTFQRSSSNLNPSRGESHPSSDFSPRIVDQNQTVRNYLIKASAGNTSGSVYAPNKMSNGAQHHLPIQHQQQGNSVSRNAPLARQLSNMNGGGGGDDLRTRTVNIVREASNIVTKIMTGTDAIALDCKGYNLGFNGFITLIQFGFIPRGQSAVAAGANPSATSSLRQQLAKENRESVTSESPKPEVCVFDLITNPELAYCLKPLLESDQIVKIVHDVRNKSNALYTQFGIILNNVFDTQVANLVIQQQETGKPAYKSRFISMSKLCEVYGNESLLKYRKIVKTKHCGSMQSSSSSSSNKSKDVNYWRTRPLTEMMVYEATMDVYCLVGGIYQNLRSQIKPEYEPLFEQLNVEGVLARIKPDEIRSVRKERKIDLEVIDLKRKLYSDTTSSIVLSNREIRLLRHVDLTEEVRQKIQQCRKVAKKLERLDMKAAQNAQMLQSMNSQVSSNDADQSMDNQEESLQTNGTSDGASNKTTSDAEQTPAGARDFSGDMDDLMDSSMFDELKDKMIESSSLLESLEDDDDNCVERLTQSEEKKSQSVAASSNSAAINDTSTTHEHSDGCRCNCHHQSSIDDNGSEKLQLSSLKSSQCSSDKDEGSSLGSRVVDMAVQCDLLS